MLTVRRSYLDEYRRAVTDTGGKLTRLAAQIKGQEKDVPWYMHAGTAWHEVLESPQENIPRSGRLHTVGGYCFDSGIANDALSYRGPGVLEVPGSLVVMIDGKEVELTGTADHLNGLVIRDAKTTFKAVDVGDYADSLQWRLYLLIHHARVFVYDCFSFQDPDESGYLQFEGVESFRFWAYPGMLGDVLEWADDFLSWATSKDLLPYLEKPS